MVQYDVLLWCISERFVYLFDHSEKFAYNMFYYILRYALFIAQRSLLLDFYHFFTRLSQVCTKDTDDSTDVKVAEKLSVVMPQIQVLLLTIIINTVYHAVVTCDCDVTNLRDPTFLFGMNCNSV